MKCPYCNNKAVWCENKEVYGRNFGNSYMIWLCKPCDAYVGCHQNTKRPLGTLANAELRNARKITHSIIDPVWKSKKISRKNFYKRISKEFGREIHVGESDIETCREIVRFVRKHFLTDVVTGNLITNKYAYK